MTQVRYRVMHGDASGTSQPVHWRGLTTTQEADAVFSSITYDKVRQPRLASAGIFMAVTFTCFFHSLRWLIAAAPWSTSDISCALGF